MVGTFCHTTGYHAMTNYLSFYT